jgi:class 3 adenylate cyclase
MIGAAVLLPPAALVAFLLVSPAHNATLRVPTGHVMVVTTVSLLAAFAAIMIARAALQLDQHRIFLISLGFVAMAGFFAVHAVATPGILLHGPGIYAAGELYGEEEPPPAGHSGLHVSYVGTIIGLSAFLSLGVPAFLLAFAFSPAAAALAERPRRTRAVLFVTVLFLAAFTFGVLMDPATVIQLSGTEPPFGAVTLVALTVLSSALLIYAGIQLAGTYQRTHLPMHGSLALAAGLLVEAQVVMLLAPFWSLAWWGYHLLMLTAVVIALGAIFVELDRRRGLERFVSSDVVQRMVAGEAPPASGERRVLTILFADLRGSTALADELPVDEVVEVINSYVSAIARCVLEAGGAVDKYTGDGLMAIFGLHEDDTQGAGPAARAAREIYRRLRALSRERTAGGKPALDFGVAINTGDVILTAMGLSERADFTAIGDTVNTTSRLEGMCKELGVNIVVSASSAERLGRDRYDLVSLGNANVRGKREAISVYTLRMRDVPAA